MLRNLRKIIKRSIYGQLINSHRARWHVIEQIFQRVTVKARIRMYLTAYGEADKREVIEAVCRTSDTTEENVERQLYYLMGKLGEEESGEIKEDASTRKLSLVKMLPKIVLKEERVVDWKPAGIGLGLLFIIIGFYEGFFVMLAGIFMTLFSLAVTIEDHTTVTPY